MDRPTKDITTPSGIKVTLKTYLTIGEANDALRATFKGRVADGTAKVPLEVGIDRNMQLVLAAVVSIDDKPEDIQARITAMRISDFNAIFAEVKDLSEGSF